MLRTIASAAWRSIRRRKGAYDTTLHLQYLTVLHPCRHGGHALGLSRQLDFAAPFQEPAPDNFFAIVRRDGAPLARRDVHFSECFSVSQLVESIQNRLQVISFYVRPNERKFQEACPVHPVSDMPHPMTTLSQLLLYFHLHSF